jgi:hypothetical protein
MVDPRIISDMEPKEIDPGHLAKRARLNRIAKLLLISGGVVAILGAVFFEHSPLMVLGFFAVIAGALLLFFANSGKIARYAAAENVPVQKDVMLDVAPVANQVIRGAAESARQGWEGAKTVECGKCHARQSDGAKICAECGAALPGNS